MKNNVLRGIGSVAALMGLGLLSLVQPVTAHCQSASTPLALRGKIASLKGHELLLATASGEVKLSVNDKTVVRQEVPMKFSEITPGMYVGATATKQTDGLFLASALHIFSEDQRGTGEGHRPLSSAPQSGATMTNANVDRVEELTVQDIKGRVLNLKYKDGEVRVLVPPDIPVVKRVLADRSALKSGAEVSAQALRSADNSLIASQIIVRVGAR
jgi:hypothetical protein